jgi:tetratricopeptide (TPR) repeat protein
MRYRLLCAAVAFAACCPWQAAAADLAAARALYVSASYDEALAMLVTLDGAAADEIHQMRALCLFALGRRPAAEEAIEQMVISNPVRTVSANDASPKFVELFTEVRRRALPAAARAAYTKAKAQYDTKRWPEAVASFAALTRLLSEPDVAAASDLADLRQLGEGFLRLSESEVAAAEAARAAAAVPPAPAAAPSPSAVTVSYRRWSCGGRCRSGHPPTPRSASSARPVPSRS